MAVVRRKDTVVIIVLRASRPKLSWDFGKSEQRVNATQTTYGEPRRFQLPAELDRIIPMKLELVIVLGVRETLGVGSDEQPPPRLEHAMHFAQRREIPAIQRHVL
jgi:hypothetical protein